MNQTENNILEMLEDSCSTFDLYDEYPQVYLQL